MGDWIIFKVEDSAFILPKSVLIENPYRDDCLKSIELSVSVDGAEFEPFAVIHNIPPGNDKYQDLEDVKIGNAQLWKKGYKFVKLEVLSNRGGDWNEFFSFSLSGIVCVPRK